MSRSPVKPKRSSIEVAVTSPSRVRVTRRTDSTVASTRARRGPRDRRSTAGSGAGARRCGRAAPGRRWAPSSPESSASTEVLPAPLTPTSRPGRRGRAARWRATAAPRSPRTRSTSSRSTHVLAQPLGGEPLQLQPVARRGHVVDQRVGRVDPELRLRGPRRRAAAQPGQLLAHQVLPAYLGGRRLPLALGLGQHERGVPAVVGVDDAVVHLPRRARTPRRGTTGRA